jgi:hypothetical protein
LNALQLRLRRLFLFQQRVVFHNTMTWDITSLVMPFDEKHTTSKYAEYYYNEVMALPMTCLAA